MKRLAMLLLLFWPCGQAYAASVVVRDSIGVDSTLTDGMPGGVTIHQGADWNSPGLVVDALNTGLLSEARFVIFARNQTLDPENDLLDIYTYQMEFHLWTDGVLGGTDSFDQNPRGLPLDGHVYVYANSPVQSLITVQPWGHTGPPDDLNMFTTFLVTVDLSSANVELQGGQQYVMSLLQKASSFGTPANGLLGGYFRISGSNAVDPNGQEDLFRDNFSGMFPGYLDSQLAFGYEQYAGSYTMGNGDYDGDNDVDGADFLQWQRNFGQSVSPAQDSNGDGVADGKDLNVWQAMYGESWAAPVAANTTVPEPTKCGLVLLFATTSLLAGRRRR